MTFILLTLGLIALVAGAPLLLRGAARFAVPAGLSLRAPRR